MITLKRLPYFLGPLGIVLLLYSWILDMNMNYDRSYEMIKAVARMHSYRTMGVILIILAVVISCIKKEIDKI